MVRFSKFTQNKEIYDKFKKFLSKLVWRETLFYSVSLHVIFLRPPGYVKCLLAAANNSHFFLGVLYGMVGIEIQCTMQFTLLSLTIFFEQRFTAPFLRNGGCGNILE